VVGATVAGGVVDATVVCGASVVPVTVVGVDPDTVVGVDPDTVVDVDVPGFTVVVD
jgi:hypothetical protein